MTPSRIVASVYALHITASCREGSSGFGFIWFESSIAASYVPCLKKLGQFLWFCVNWKAPPRLSLTQILDSCLINVYCVCSVHVLRVFLCLQCVSIESSKIKCSSILSCIFSVVDSVAFCLLALHGLPNPLAIIDKPIHDLLFIQFWWFAKLHLFLLWRIPMQKFELLNWRLGEL